MGVREFIGRPDRGFEGLKVARHPASVASGEVLFWFGDLERGVCSSIGRRDRGFGSLKWLGILPRWLRGRFCFGFGYLERVVCSSIGHRDRGFEGLKWLGSCLGGESGRQFDGCPGLWGKLKDGLKNSDSHRPKFDGCPGFP